VSWLSTLKMGGFKESGKIGQTNLYDI